MHEVIVGLQGQLHDVANGIGILRYLDPERVFHRAHRSQRMGTGAHTTNPFGKGPGIARVTALQDHFQSAPHRAGRHGIADDIILINIHFTTQVPFNPRDRIHHDAATGVIQRKTIRCFDNTHFCSPLSFARFKALTAACATTAVPTTAAAVPPTASALDSMPN